MEDNLNGEDLNGRRAQWKMTYIMDINGNETNTLSNICRSKTMM
jgi:hypothetical protein